MRFLFGLITILWLYGLCFLSQDAFAVPYTTLPSDTAPLLLTPPAHPDSASLKKETRAIINLQETADEQEIRESDSERNPKPEMIAMPVDAVLTRDRYPSLYALLDRAGETAGQAIGDAKRHWRITRPYLVDSDIKALIEAHDSYAYPSGHATLGYIWAGILGMIFPDKHKALHDRAEEMAQHRVLVGMHYPQDLRGGKELAFLVLGSLLTQPEFIRDLAMAKEESELGREVIRESTH